MEFEIRPEVENDYREVEELTREAFWNLFVPGCCEHYMVHTMRSHPDFIATLALVAVLDSKIVGNIMYTKAHLADQRNNEIEIATFGPVSVLPAYQRQGIGSTLISHSRQIAAAMGFKAIVIHGHPQNYCKHGFKSAKDFNIADSEGRFPYSLLALELQEGFFNGHQGRYFEIDAYNIDMNESEEFDKTFKPKKKEYRYTQEVFHIASRAFLL